MSQGNSEIVGKGNTGWRAAKGPTAGNTSGFSATGHRVLCLPEVIKEKTEGGIVLLEKTRQAEKSLSVYVKVIEIGHDAWSDKSTDYCEVGDTVLVGQYVGKFEVSPKDGKEYRIVNDLDIISRITE